MIAVISVIIVFVVVVFVVVIIVVVRGIGGGAVTIDHRGDIGVSVVVGDVARRVVRRGECRQPNLTEPGRYPLADRLQLSRRCPQALALVDEELFELVDIADQELTAGDERLHLVEGCRALGLGGATRLVASVFEKLGRHLSRRIDRGFGLGPGLVADSFGLALRLGNGEISRALREQQRARDRLGLVGRDLRRLAHRCRPGGSLVRRRLFRGGGHLLQA
jgi:hypothetical protein